MKKMKWIILLILFGYFLFPSVAHADHVITGMSDSDGNVKVKPHKYYDQLTDAEKQDAQDLINNIKADWKAMIKKGADHPIIQLDEDPVTWIDKSVKDNYESSYLGDIDSYSDGSLGLKMNTLYMTYGILLHYDRYPNGGMFCLGECNGPIKLVKNVKFSQTGSTTKVTSYDIIYPKEMHVNSGAKDKTGGKMTTITSMGLFTSSQSQNFGSCDVTDVKKKLADAVKKPKVKDPDKVEGSPAPPFSIDGVKDKMGEEAKETTKNIANDTSNYVLGLNCDKDSLSVLAQFLNISRALNITDNMYVMKLVYITQQVAFAMTIVIIAFFALMFTTGYQNMDPIKFGVRLFFCILGVNYLPWLMQDVLNLNNVIVYNLSTLNLSFDGVEGNTTEIIAGAIRAVVDSLFSSDFAESLLLLILVIIMAIFAIAPLLKIVMWWYVRLLNIFLAAVVGPMLIMLAALPQTAKTAQKWINSYIGSVFEQIFMALGLMMVAVILGNIGDFGETIGVGWFGRMILVYASIYFLSDVPAFAKNFLSNFGGGKDYSGGLAKAARTTAKKGTRYGMRTAEGAVTVGAAAATGAAAGAVGLGMGLAGKKVSSLSGSTSRMGKMANKLMTGTKTGKAMGTVSNLTGRGTRGGTKFAAKQTAQGVGGVIKGASGQGALSGKGLLGKAGSIVGATGLATTIAGVHAKGAIADKTAKTARKVKDKAKESIKNTVENAYKNNNYVPFQRAKDEMKKEYKNETGNEYQDNSNADANDDE